MISARSCPTGSRNARESQKDAKEQFATALDQFKSVVDFDGGKLQEVYEKLNDEYEDCKDQADDVKARIDSVEDVADALFDEWSAEIKEYSSAKLRRSSEQKLAATKKKYNGLIRAMRNAEKKMQPVLSAFHDQVLYLKHNLNAKAIASLQGELTSIRTDVDALINGNGQIHRRSRLLHQDPGITTTPDNKKGPQPVVAGPFSFASGGALAGRASPTSTKEPFEKGSLESPKLFVCLRQERTGAERRRVALEGGVACLDSVPARTLQDGCQRNWGIVKT